MKFVRNNKKIFVIFDFPVKLCYTQCAFLYLTYIVMITTKKFLSVVAVSALSLQAFADDTTGTGVTSTGVTATGSVVETTVAPAVNLLSTSISWVETIDSKTLVVRLGTQLPVISPNSEAKILEDLGTVTSVKDTTNLKKITLALTSDLQDGKNYSIISVSEGLDSSIDFNFSGDTSKIMNAALVGAEMGIEYISVVDAKTVEVYLNQDATLPTYDFKVFKEMSSQNMFLDTTNLNIQLDTSLVSNKDYILILNLKDAEDKDIEVENSLYDFVTGEFTDVQPLDEAVSADTMAVTQSWVIAESASWVTVEAAAMEATRTPDTGTKTNVLLFLTFMLTLSIFMMLRRNEKV